MASRSTVSTPVAVASAAAWLASGDSTLPMAFGSETMFMPHFTRRTAGVQPCRPGSVRARRQMAVLRKIAEPGELPLELQSNRTCRSVALLGDNDFSLSESLIHFGLPFCVFFRTGLG